jgi:hypothetical protein
MVSMISHAKAPSAADSPAKAAVHQTTGLSAIATRSDIEEDLHRIDDRKRDDKFKCTPYHPH